VAFLQLGDGRLDLGATQGDPSRTSHGERLKNDVDESRCSTVRLGARRASGLHQGTIAAGNLAEGGIEIEIRLTSQTEGGIIAGGRFEMHGATMLDLISEAYGLDPKVVVRDPSWLNEHNFDQRGPRFRRGSPESGMNSSAATHTGAQNPRSGLINVWFCRPSFAMTLALPSGTGPFGIQLCQAWKRGECDTERFIWTQKLFRYPQKGCDRRRG